MVHMHHEGVAAPARPAQGRTPKVASAEMAQDMSPSDADAAAGRGAAAARAVRLDELEAIDVAGVVFHPLRRRLGVRSFGINAYSARAAGDHVIEPHDETGAGAGGHEELYLV